MNYPTYITGRKSLIELTWVKKERNPALESQKMLKSGDSYKPKASEITSFSGFGVALRFSTILRIGLIVLTDTSDGCTFQL